MPFFVFFSNLRFFNFTFYVIFLFGFTKNVNKPSCATLLFI